MKYDNSKLQPWIKFTRLFESISCITRISAHNFRNNSNLNKSLRNFYVSTIDIDNAFTRTCYDIRNGKSPNVNLCDFNIPDLSPTCLNNVDELKKLLSETIIETKEPLNLILSDIPENTESKLSYLEKPIKNFLSSVEDIKGLL
ncbi:hypothetical protein SAMN04487886_104512 [Clostridium sp. DSM 8431]|uniref:hypothetical protein n=1 Tax=Clostridium sp. DSM 8431 TaxID=1761781 RepID=UPI0008E7CA9B|nr:hypothetical protein [Clostridium sp. DSM 8431]SFU51483.1 hypothetical protein SAMN04487886_104512 [Clostridium sp. DSM 8431]